MKMAQTELQERINRQDKQKEEVRQEQRARQAQSISASAMAQMLTGGYARGLQATMMSRAMAQRLGNAAMTALMGEDGYQPEHLPAKEESPTDPFDADGEPVPDETLP